jgi:hypothetical protein
LLQCARNCIHSPRNRGQSARNSRSHGRILAMNRPQNLDRRFAGNPPRARIPFFGSFLVFHNFSGAGFSLWVLAYVKDQTPQAEACATKFPRLIAHDIPRIRTITESQLENHFRMRKSRIGVANRRHSFI